MTATRRASITQGSTETSRDAWQGMSAHNRQSIDSNTPSKRRRSRSPDWEEKHNWANRTPLKVLDYNDPQSDQLLISSPHRYSPDSRQPRTGCPHWDRNRLTPCPSPTNAITFPPPPSSLPPPPPASSPHLLHLPRQWAPRTAGGLLLGTRASREERQEIEVDFHALAGSVSDPIVFKQEPLSDHDPHPSYAIDNKKPAIGAPPPDYLRPKPFSFKIISAKSLATGGLIKGQADNKIHMSKKKDGNSKPKNKAQEISRSRAQRPSQDTPSDDEVESVDRTVVGPHSISPSFPLASDEILRLREKIPSRTAPKLYSHPISSTNSSLPRSYRPFYCPWSSISEPSLIQSIETGRLSRESSEPAESPRHASVASPKAPKVSVVSNGFRVPKAGETPKAPPLPLMVSKTVPSNSNDDCIQQSLERRPDSATKNSQTANRKGGIEPETRAKLTAATQRLMALLNGMNKTVETSSTKETRSSSLTSPQRTPTTKKRKDRHSPEEMDPPNVQFAFSSQLKKSRFVDTVPPVGPCSVTLGLEVEPKIISNQDGFSISDPKDSSLPSITHATVGAAKNAPTQIPVKVGANPSPGNASYAQQPLPIDSAQNMFPAQSAPVSQQASSLGQVELHSNFQNSMAAQTSQHFQQPISPPLGSFATQTPSFFDNHYGLTQYPQHQSQLGQNYPMVPGAQVIPQQYCQHTTPTMAAGNGQDHTPRLSNPFLAYSPDPTLSMPATYFTNVFSQYLTYFPDSMVGQLTFPQYSSSWSQYQAQMNVLGYTPNPYPSFPAPPYGYAPHGYTYAPNSYPQNVPVANAPSAYPPLFLQPAQNFPAIQQSNKNQGDTPDLVQQSSHNPPPRPYTWNAG